MPRYQVYGVDQCGAIIGERWIDAPDDEAAISAVRSMARRYECQVWKRDFRIARVPAHGTERSDAGA